MSRDDELVVAEGFRHFYVGLLWQGCASWLEQGAHEKSGLDADDLHHFREHVVKLWNSEEWLPGTREVISEIEKSWSAALIDGTLEAAFWTEAVFQPAVFQPAGAERRKPEHANRWLRARWEAVKERVADSNGNQHIPSRAPLRDIPSFSKLDAGAAAARWGKQAAALHEWRELCKKRRQNLQSVRSEGVNQILEKCRKLRASTEDRRNATWLWRATIDSFQTQFLEDVSATIQDVIRLLEEPISAQQIVSGGPQQPWDRAEEAIAQLLADPEHSDWLPSHLENWLSDGLGQELREMILEGFVKNPRPRTPPIPNGIPAEMHQPLVLLSAVVEILDRAGVGWKYPKPIQKLTNSLAEIGNGAAESWRVQFYRGEGDHSPEWEKNLEKIPTLHLQSGRDLVQTGIALESPQGWICIRAPQQKVLSNTGGILAILAKAVGPAAEPHDPELFRSSQELRIAWSKAASLLQWWQEASPVQKELLWYAVQRFHWLARYESARFATHFDRFAEELARSGFAIHDALPEGATAAGPPGIVGVCLIAPARQSKSAKAPLGEPGCYLQDPDQQIFLPAIWISNEADEAALLAARKVCRAMQPLLQLCQQDDIWLSAYQNFVAHFQWDSIPAGKADSQLARLTIDFWNQLREARRNAAAAHKDALKGPDRPLREFLTQTLGCKLLPAMADDGKRPRPFAEQEIPDCLRVEFRRSNDPDGTLLRYPYTNGFSAATWLVSRGAGSEPELAPWLKLCPPSELPDFPPAPDEILAIFRTLRKGAVKSLAPDDIEQVRRALFDWSDSEKGSAWLDGLIRQGAETSDEQLSAWYHAVHSLCGEFHPNPIGGGKAAWSKKALPTSIRTWEYDSAEPEGNVIGDVRKFAIKAASARCTLSLGAQPKDSLVVRSSHLKKVCGRCGIEELKGPVDHLVQLTCLQTFQIFRGLPTDRSALARAIHELADQLYELAKGIVGSDLAATGIIGNANLPDLQALEDVLSALRSVGDFAELQIQPKQWTFTSPLSYTDLLADELEIARVEFLDIPLGTVVLLGFGLVDRSSESTAAESLGESQADGTAVEGSSAAQQDPLRLATLKISAGQVPSGYHQSIEAAEAAGDLVTNELGVLLGDLKSMPRVVLEGPVAIDHRIWGIFESTYKHQIASGVNGSNEMVAEFRKRLQELTESLGLEVREPTRYQSKDSQTGGWLEVSNPGQGGKELRAVLRPAVFRGDTNVIKAKVELK